MLDIKRTSTLSGKTRTKQLPITQEQMDMYDAGIYYKAAFPDLSEEDFRFLAYGITVSEHAAYRKKDKSRKSCCGG